MKKYIVVNIVCLVIAFMLGATIQKASSSGIACKIPGISCEKENPLVQEPVLEVSKQVGESVVQIETDEGLGSGVIVDNEGIVITNAHVVDTNKRVKVRFSDGVSLNAEVLGKDAFHDIAVVKIQHTDRHKITPARFSSEQPETGQVAIAIGSPFGLSQSVTSGIVSAANRPINSSDTFESFYVQMIQTDAPINHGNSGGPLLNARGEVIGINTLAHSDGQNLGFAIPIVRAKSVATEIIENKRRKNPLVGVAVKRSKKGIVGAQITDIESKSPASKSDLKTDDVVTSVNGVLVQSAEELAAIVNDFRPDETITLQVQRDGQEQNIQVSLGVRKEQEDSSGCEDSTESFSRNNHGESGCFSSDTEVSADDVLDPEIRI